jgi:hypothetical protein
MKSVGFAEWHEKDMVVPETNHFSQGGVVMPGGFDPAHFADRDQGPFRFNDQPDDLLDQAAILDQPALAHPLEQVFEPVH